MDFLTSFLGRNGFLPHGYCFTWSPELLWPMVSSDALTAAAYFSIPVMMLGFARQRADASVNKLAWLFSAFIVACGVTHLMDVWTIWQPDYGWQVLSKAVTALLSVATALALWRLLPAALRIPSVSQLQGVIGKLETEVGKRRSAEEHLADTQQSLAMTLASIDAGFIATDRAGCVTHMNAIAERVLGWSAQEARGQSLWKVFDREDRPAGYLERNPVDVMVSEAVTVQVAHHVVAIGRTGTHTAVEVKAALTRGDDGTVRGLAMVFRDMTAAVEAEAESSRLAAIVESSNDAIIGKTLEGRITSWNRAAQTMFGYTAQEAVGRPVQMLIPPGHDDEEMRILAKLAQGEQVPPFDTVRRRRDGRLVEVSVAISPIRDARGRIVGASKVARDISEQKLAEAARLKANRLEAENRQIQEANRLKSQFLANMSHELRTPLNAVIGFADLLHSGAVPPESIKHRAFLGHIASSGRHLLQLINDVLDLSKVESGKFEFFPERVHLPTLVTELGDTLQTALQRKRILLVTDIDPALGDLQLDPARLKQALYNYLSNAIKFTPDGGHVTVRARLEGPRQFRLEVEDNGIGIAEADLPRLFTEFQQLDAGYSKQHPGTGLGLALTRRLVQAQGGSVGVRSTLGRGSVFHLVLDRVQRRTGQATHSFLVIEDEPQQQGQLVRALGEAGFEVDAATTAAQAREHVSSKAYDAITLDLLLADERGLGLLAHIRGQGLSRQSPVVAVSMATQGGFSAAFSIADVLCKPIRTDEILLAMAPFKRPGFQRARVMVIDDDPLALDLMQAALAAIGVDATGWLDGRQALHDIGQHRPEAIVLDLMMPGFNGFEVLDALRQMPAWRDVPVFIWTSMVLTDDEYTSLARSAQAILSKGGGELLAMLDDLRRWRPHGAMLAGATEGGS